jgi:cell division protein FtsB
MALMREIRRRARHVVGPVLMAGIAVYFGYHAVEGDRGLIAWWQVTQQLKDAQATYDRVHQERLALEHRVALLGPDRLDPDLLDERAHVMLDLARPDEVVIFDPGAAPPAAAKDAGGAKPAPSHK